MCKISRLQLSCYFPLENRIWHLAIHPSAHPPTHTLTHPSYLSIYLSVRPSIRPSVHASVYLSIYLSQCTYEIPSTLFKGNKHSFKEDIVKLPSSLLIKCKRKEFAPLGSKFFPFRVDSFSEEVGVQKKKQTGSHKCCLCCKLWR